MTPEDRLFGPFPGRFSREKYYVRRKEDYVMTIWHTEVPPSLRHMGIGGKLVEEVVQLASRDSSPLRKQ